MARFIHLNKATCDGSAKVSINTSQISLFQPSKRGGTFIVLNYNAYNTSFVVKESYEYVVNLVSEG